MKEYASIEEMRKDEDLLNMGRYNHTRAKIAGKEVIVCTTDEQYDNEICGAMFELLETLNNEYDLNIGNKTTDLSSYLRDNFLEFLEEESGLEFVDVYEEY